MQLYIQDRSESTVATISDFYEDMHKTLTSTGTGSYEFTVSKSEPGQEFLNVGNYVVLLDEQNKGHQFTITKVDQLHDEKTVYAEDASLQLLSKEARPWAKLAKAQPASYYFNKALKGTGWVIGVNQITNLTRTLEWTGWDTVLTRLLSIATEFDNAELDFHVELDRTNVVRKVVDIYKQVGAYRDDIQLVYGDTANDIQKTESTENFATAIEGIGSLVENTKEGEPEKHYDFSAIGYDDGDFYSPKGDPKLYSRKAHEKWDGKYGYSERHFEYETKDPQELLNRSKTELKKRCEPEVNYEISIADGRLIDISKGDTVKIFDHTYNPELLLQARAVEVDKSYTDPSQNKAIFGNFLTLISNADPRILAIQKQISQLPKARTPYPWVRYADDDKGTGMSALPAGKSYMATVWNYETAVPSDNPIDYAGKWIKVKGQDGSDGIPGSPGTDGKTPYLHTAYSWSADGTDRFMTVYPGENLLLNSDQQFTSTVSGFVTTPFNLNDIFDKYGTDQVYTISYDLSSKDPSKSSWIQAYPFPGTMPQNKYSFPIVRHQGITTTPQRFSMTFKPTLADETITRTTLVFYGEYDLGNIPIVNRIKVALGNEDNIAWTPSPLDDPEGAYPKLIGTYTDYIAEDSTDPSKYTWAKVRGEQGPKGDSGADGKPGKDGVGIKSTVVTYQLGSSGTEKPTGPWSATVPTLTKGQYLWTKTTWNYSDSTSEDGFSVSYIAKDGNDGTNGIAGKDGVGIKSTVIEYAVSSNGVTKPSTGWVATIPSVASGQFMWTRTTWSYTDNTSEVGYSVAKAGETGPKGDKGDSGTDGKPGKDGVGIKSTLIQYASNTSGTVAPTTGWTTTIPAAAPGHYVWTKYTWTYTDGTTEAGYSVGKIGETGQTGQKGDTGPRGSTGAKGTTGPIGPQGPKGDPGSKDVPVTTVSAAQPATAKNGDIWWVLNSADVATAMKVYTSGAWVDKKVDQSVLNIVTLNAVEINGSTINGSEVNISYTGTLENGQQGSSQQTLDKNGYIQTSTFYEWDDSQIVTRSEISNYGGIMMGYTPQAKYNPSQPWANSIGSIYLDPINLYIGFTGADRSGIYNLSIQDAYQNSGSATYLNGWGSWNADYSLKVVRKGRMVTVWGYIKHNNSATITPFAQVPAWARPEQGILISAVTFNSSVGNPIASALVMNAKTGRIGFNSGGQKGGYVCFSTTYVGGLI